MSSTRPPTKRLPPDERRAVIVEAAGRLFGEHGYDGARLDDIAAAAGVTKPILYRHFDSKHALYRALLARHRDDLATFTVPGPAAGPLSDRLRAVLEIWIGYVETHSYAWRMLFRDTGGGPEIQAFRVEVHDRARAVLVAIIRATDESGAIPEEELEPLAELMSMGMASVVLWWLDHPEQPRSAIIGAMTRVWTGVLSRDGRAA